MLICDMEILIVGILIAVSGQTFVDADCNASFPFYCGDGSCIERRAYCNGEKDCENGSDEIDYNETLHQGKGFNCTHSRNEEFTCFLPREYQHDHEVDCVDGIDECGFDSSFYCKNEDCTLKIQFCDGFSNCRDGSDEIPYNRSVGGFQCRVSKRHVTLSCSLPDVHVCDGSSECKWGTDECFCDFSNGKQNGTPTNGFSNNKCFRCLDGTLVIPSYLVCDGTINCQDLSDECLCPKKHDNMTKFCEEVPWAEESVCRGQLKCSKRLPNGREGKETICVKPEMICDDKYDCFNGFDEDFCESDDEFITCDDRSQKVRTILVCDGQEDCIDGSDEKNCHEEKYLCDLYRKPSISWTHLDNWNSTDEYPQLNRTLLEEDFLRITGWGWKFYYPYYATPCDGIPTCNSGKDECGESDYGPNCSNPADFCLFVRNNSLKCPNSNSYITGSEVCDGQPSCNDTAPETSADEKGCPNRFYCKNEGRTRLPIHIPKENQCDGLAECDDQSDEMNCSNATHFYCNDADSKIEGGISFISRNRVCDKRQDCKGGEDECDNCTNDPFSDDKKLIRSRILVVFLWIIGLISAIGNSLVIIHQITNIYKSRNARNSVALKNRILLLNLSCADLLMGIYLISLGIKDATVDKYCLQDQEWRSSSTCSALGVIAVIGTEASVMILLIMTSHRLHLVFRPFDQQKMPAIVVSIIFAWVIAVILATAPLSFSARDYFLSCVWFRTHHYLGYACKNEVRDFTNKLVAFEGPNATFSKIVGSDYSWNKMLDAQKILNDSYTPERYYGYYAANGVCLPRFFPDSNNDTSWGYTMFLVLLNFFAFLFILLSYIFIYKKTVSTKLTKRKEDRSTVLQRKVTRIVLTDFCCWMPICIMAFITFGGIYVGDIAYAITAIILLPINSAMNPFLYSSLLDVVWNQLEPVRRHASQTSIGRRLQSSFHKMTSGKTNTESVVTSVTNLPGESQPAENSGERSPAPKNGIKKDTNAMEMNAIHESNDE